MKKGKKVISMEVSPSTSSYQSVVGDRARFRYQSLLQDYQELLKETEAKRKQLLKSKQKKLKLQPEVMFLRKKFKSLSENPTQTNRYRLKRQPKQRGESSISQSLNRIPESEIQIKSKVSNRKEDRDDEPRNSGIIDLNQVCMLSGEEMDDFQINRESNKTEKMRNYSMERETVPNDTKVSIYSAPNRVGKRKITWQDQVALRV